MSERVIIVNTHPDENPEFVGKLAHFINSLGIEPEIFQGYGHGNPLEKSPSHIVLSGVPLDAPYSLADGDTQGRIDRAYGWLKACRCPALGVCFGHQILAHAFGGEVSSLQETVRDERLRLTWKPDMESGIFSDIGSLEVFAEHRDYVSKVPPGFRVLCQIDEKPYIIVHPEREMYGVQFVPEQSDANSKKVLKRFLEL